MAIPKEPACLLTACPPRHGRVFAWPASLGAHAAAIGFLALVAPRPSPLPLRPSSVPPALTFRLGNPPPAPPPPPPRGVTRASRRPGSVTLLATEPDAPSRDAEPVVIDPRTMTTPESAVAEMTGKEAGTDSGRPGGKVGGVEGGELGGTTGGVPGGCLGCAGDDVPGDYDQVPRILYQPPPVYPVGAFAQKIEGIVHVRILIGADGRVVTTQVVKSVPLLDEAALEAVRHWRFAPARRRGQPVASYASAPVHFRIY